MRRLTILLGVVENLYRGLFFFTLVVLGLYVLGNLQDYTDSTQIMLLDIVRGASITGVMLGLYSLSYRVFLVSTGRRGSVLPLVENALALLANTGLLLGLAALQSWLRV
jgi:hypothetical protein